MKTTVKISDVLLDEARRVATRRGVTVRALIEEGLRQVVKAAGRRSTFVLRDASFKGEGLSPDFAEGDWERVREVVYKGRGA